LVSLLRGSRFYYGEPAGSGSQAAPAAVTRR
jgi:hypothetical protein